MPLNATKILPVLGAMLLLALPACQSRHAVSESGPDKTAAPFVFAIHGDYPPSLTTNEVMRIALQAARAQHWPVQNYACDVFSFAGNTTNVWLTNKWLLHFTETPPVPDSDFSVLIDDTTGRAEIFHY